MHVHTRTCERPHSRARAHRDTRTHPHKHTPSEAHGRLHAHARAWAPSTNNADDWILKQSQTSNLHYSTAPPRSLPCPRRLRAASVPPLDAPADRVFSDLRGSRGARRLASELARRCGTRGRSDCSLKQVSWDLWCRMEGSVCFSGVFAILEISNYEWVMFSSHSGVVARWGCSTGAGRVTRRRRRAAVRAWGGRMGVEL